MDFNTAVLIGAIVVVVAVVVIALKRWKRFNIKSTTPLGKLEIQASKDSPVGPPAIQGKDITSRQGGVNVADGTGKGVDLQQVDAEKDINITTSTPGRSSSKKA